MKKNGEAIGCAIQKLWKKKRRQRGAAKVARPRHFIRVVVRPPHFLRGRPTLDGKKGLFRSFLIRLKARLLGNLKKGLGNLKYNLETFQGARDGYGEDLDS